MNELLTFLHHSYTPYHATENVKNLLLENGFTPLKETEDWVLNEGGKYFVERGGSALIAFTIENLDGFSFKIIASHTDSPALKIKENPATSCANCVKLNVEKYGSGLWYSFLDRPLKIAGRLVKNTEDGVCTQTYLSPFNVCIPSVAIHQNRQANEGFAINAQVDLQPLYSLCDGHSLNEELSENDVISYDLYAVNADMPHSFGVNDEFILSPRIDNLTSVYASLNALLNHTSNSGVCVAAFFDNEEVGSRSAQGADGDFMEITLRRLAYSLKFDDIEYYKALANSFFLSLDNAHATHPNHPEKSDPTNQTLLGNGIVIKHHASKAYTTDALSAGVLKNIFKKADVAHQDFFNRSDAASGSTLGSLALTHTGIMAADIGLAQLAMHSANECFAKKDYETLIRGLTAFYSTKLTIDGQNVKID